jgi:D-3-phosphoglycerate dehydrogenase
VVEEEYTKRPPDDPLLEYARTHDNLILTPHIGGMTVESREKTDMILAEILCGLGD